MKYIDIIKANYVNILFYLVAAVFIGVLKGLKVVILLTLFILLFGLLLSTVVGVYNMSKGINDKKLPLTTIGALVVGGIIYFGYGTQVFVMTQSYTLALTIIVALVIIYFANKK